MVLENIQIIRDIVTTFNLMDHLRLYLIKKLKNLLWWLLMQLILVNIQELIINFLKKELEDKYISLLLVLMG